MSNAISSKAAWVRELFLMRENALKKVYGDIAPLTHTAHYSKSIETSLKEGLAPSTIHRMTPFYKGMPPSFQRDWLCVSIHGIHYSSAKKLEAQTQLFLTRTAFKYNHLNHLCRQPNQYIKSLNEWDKLTTEIFECTKRIALKLSSRYLKYSVKKEELVSELSQVGLESLWQDILNYNPAEEYSFSTMATHNIKMNIARYWHKNTSLIPMPIKKITPLLQISKEIDIFHLKNGENMNDKDLQKKIKLAGLDEKDLTHFNHNYCDVNLNYGETGSCTDAVNIDQKKHINQAIGSIEDPYKSILKFYYYKESLDDSESNRINQYLESFEWTIHILKKKRIKALALLREKLAPIKDELF